MTRQLIECVPNFSEGRDMQVIGQITAVIEGTEGVRLIGVDPGRATNRTVVTFVGSPAEVCEAAFSAVRKASELIDMRRHHGEHPRFGATDVCPLVPVAHISMEEVTAWSRKLAQRIGEELHIPVYCYEFAAFNDKKKNLAACRQGEYEGLQARLADPEWKPDFGPVSWNDQTARTGATAVGARHFLIAYNINLNTTSKRRANAIAFDIREKGRVKREGHPVTGKIVRDLEGNPVYEKGLLRHVKAIGWYIEEYGIAQVSANLTDIDTTPMHVVFDAACERAAARGMRVTGSELVGLAPLKAFLDAGRHYLHKQHLSAGIPEGEIVRMAVKSMGLDDLAPFDPDKKIIEYLLADRKEKKLVHSSLETFASLTSADTPTPGGGSVAAYVGALAASLGAMVANLSAHKPGWDDRREEFSAWAEKGMELQQALLRLVDEDSSAFNLVMDAYRMPKKTVDDIAVRKDALEKAGRRAMDVPLQVMRTALDIFPLVRAMAAEGNASSASDAGVGAVCARAAITAALLNVRTNAVSLEDQKYADAALADGGRIEAEALQQEREILEVVGNRMLKT